RTGETRRRDGEARGRTRAARGRTGEARGRTGEARGRTGEARGPAGQARRKEGQARRPRGPQVMARHTERHMTMRNVITTSIIGLALILGACDKGKDAAKADKQVAAD